MPTEYFVVGGWDQYRAVSKDGVNWEHVSFSEKQALTCTGVTFGQGTCALLFKRGYFGTSNLDFTSDGENWETHEIKADQVGHSVVFFNDQYIVCTGKTINAGHKPAVVVTEDGNKWSKAYDIPGRSIMTHYAEGNGKLVGIGPSGMAAATTDGTDWQVADLETSESMISLAFGNGFFVGGGLHGQTWRSEDGLAWEKTNEGDEGEHVNTTIWDGEKFLGIGLGATYLSGNGKDWDRLPNENAPLSAVLGSNGLYLGNQWKGRLMSSMDGIQWKEQQTFERHVETVGFGVIKG